MEEKLKKLYIECVEGLNKLGIDILNEKKYGKISISVSKRNNKRYGCCKQEEPDRAYKTVSKIGRRRTIRYEKYNKHQIEVSKWVLELDDDIIKNTIMHELIHCIPYCNNHGTEFKKYANLINAKYGYDVARVGDKKKDFEKSNVEFSDKINYRYKGICKGCNQEFFRQRIIKNFTRKYRCAKCGGRFEIELLQKI